MFYLRIFLKKTDSWIKRVFTKQRIKPETLEIPQNSMTAPAYVAPRTAWKDLVFLIFTQILILNWHQSHFKNKKEVKLPEQK